MQLQKNNFLKKENLKYKFTVEGDTEAWYLNWLEKKINGYLDTHDSLYCVEIIPKQILPHRMARNAKPHDAFVHICDYEGNTPSDMKRFEDILKSIYEAKNESFIDYQLAYTNPTFEYWLILHKAKSCCSFTGIEQINTLFGTDFEGLKEYKIEKNFKMVLDKLTLEDVKHAICLGEIQDISNKKDITRSLPKRKSGITYYSSPPATSLHGYISKIFKECGIKWK